MGFYLSPLVASRELDISNIIPAVATSIGAIVGYSERGPLEPTLMTNTKELIERYGKPLTTGHYMHYSALAYLAKANKLYVRRVATAYKFGGVLPSPNDGTTTQATQAFEAGEVDPTSHTFASDELFLIYGADPGTWNDNLKVKINNIDDETFSFDITVKETLDDGSVITRVARTVSRKATQIDGYGKNMYIETVFENDPYIRIVDNTDIADTIVPNLDATYVTFNGGDNGTEIDDSAITTGWDDFADADRYDVTILINGGYTTSAVQTKINTVAIARKDCIAILDIPFANTSQAEAIVHRTTTLAINSSYSCLVTPWVKDYDQYNGRYIYVPLSGYVAAQMAFTDFVRDAWWAPAGLNRGIIDATGPVSEYYSLGQRDLLYDNQINPVIKHKTGAIAIWGQKTLTSKPSALDRINVRRLLITIEKAITTSLEYFLFEPNDDGTRVQITAMIEDYLRDIKARRGVYDFNVVCDETNNTGTRIDRNELWVDIYIQPTKAAEFIQLQTIITKTGANFEELLGSI